MFMVVRVVTVVTGDWRRDSRADTECWAGDGATNACANGRLLVIDAATARPANAAAVAPTVGRLTMFCSSKLMKMAELTTDDGEERKAREILFYAEHQGDADPNKLVRRQD